MEKRLVRVAEIVLEHEKQPAASPAKWIRPVPGLMKLDENENTVGPSPEVSEILGEYLRTRPLNWYESGKPEEQLKEKLSNQLSLPIEAISCFNGSRSAFECVVRTYLETGVEALIDSPCDTRISAIARSTGAMAKSIEHVDPFKPQIETIINNINLKTRLIYLPNPNDLSGSAYTESEIVFLLAYAERIMVVVEEEFVEFCGWSAADLVMRFPNLAIIRSFSKALGLASLQAGYLISDPENMELIERLKLANNISSLACTAVCAALDDPNHVRQYAGAVTQSKKILNCNLPQFGYEFQLGAANFVLLKVSSSEKAIKLLLKENILTRELSDHDSLNSYIRITVGTPSQMEKLVLILGRMAPQLATGYNRNRQEPALNRPALKLQEIVRVN